MVLINKETQSVRGFAMSLFPDDTLETMKNKTQICCISMKTWDLVGSGAKLLGRGTIFVF